MALCVPVSTPGRYDRRMQSPIALNSRTAASRVGSASTSYHHMSSVTLADVGNTVSAKVEPGGVMDLDGRQYVLQEVHCHAPSEHTVDGTSADLEAHFVHRSIDGNIAVVAVLHDVVESESPIDAFIATPGGPPTTEQLHLVVPTGSRAFHYEGSLTTPPYTPGVQWVVYVDRMPVGQVALAEFTDRYGPNNREIQLATDAEVTIG